MRPMRPTRLIFAEGILGSGKTTTARFLARTLQERQRRACFVPEGGHEHSLRVALTLPHPFQIWRDVTADQYIEISIQRWQAFVAESQPSGQVVVADGLLFHGNLTDVLLMDAPFPVMQHYVARVASTIAPLEPVVLYCYQRDVGQALARTCATRGQEWTTFQINWKIGSPYCTRQGLHGYEGFVQLYETYRALCDTLVAALPFPTLMLDTTDGDWPRYYREMLAFLQLQHSTESTV